MKIEHAKGSHQWRIVRDEISEDYWLYYRPKGQDSWGGVLATYETEAEAVEAVQKAPEHFPVEVGGAYYHGPAFERKNWAHPS